jgi:hypothetical protein
LNVVGAVFSTICSIAKLPRVVARTSLISGWTCGTSCRLQRRHASPSGLRSMWTPLLQIPFAHIACPGPWLLGAFFILQGCPHSRSAAACNVIAAFVFLVGVSVAGNAVPAGSRVFASGFVRRSLSALALPSASRVDGRCPLPFRPARVLRLKPRWVRAWSPIWGFFLQTHALMER